MKKVNLTILLLVVGMLSSFADGIPDMKFRRLDTRDGLANSQVKSVLRDRHGFMWFATPFGLCRYDGYRFRNFYSFERDTMTLRSNRVDEVQEAHDGRLWLNHGMNYSVFDPITEKVDRTPSRWLASLGMKGGLETVCIDSQKRYWVKSYDSGFYCYNPHTKHLTKIAFGYEMGSFPKDFAISHASDYKDDAQLFVSNLGELMCVDGNVGVVQWRDDYVKKAMNTFTEYDVFYDKPNDQIWVLSHTTGTFVYKVKQKQWYSTLTDYLRAEGFQNIPDDIVVWDVAYDSKGYLWVATDHRGLLVLDFKTKTWRQFLNVKNDDSSLPESTLRSFYLDQMGRMWVATYKNGLAMNADALANFISLPVGDVNTICEDKQGYWWIGLNSGGLLKMNPQTHEVVDSFRRQQMGALNDVMVGSYCAKDGTLWFGTWEGGAIRYKNGEWTNYTVSTPGSKLETNNVWSVTEDYWGNIWLGMLGGGLVRIDKKTGAQRSFTEKNSSLKTVWTNSVSVGSNKWIVVGNSEYCAFVNPQNFKIVNMPPPHDESTYTISNASIQVIYDSRKLIWQASSSGLSINDRNTGQCYLLDMKAGFYGSNVVAIVEDNRHTMWVVTDHGVSNVTPQKDEDDNWVFSVRSYNDHDGLQPGPFNQRAICYTRTGYVLVGGQDGLDIINTRKLAADQVKEKPVFSGLVVFNDLIEAGQKYNGRVILEKTLSQTDCIELKYSENQFTIEMASDNGGINNGTCFVYRLEGFNDKWMRTSEVNPNITYMGLPSGSYTLCVRMLKGDGTMGEDESRLNIIVGTPWYRTWWAFLLYLLILGGAFGWWYKNRSMLLKRKKEFDDFKHETEKLQWMNEMHMQMQMPKDGEVQKPVTKDDITLQETKSDIVSCVEQVCESYQKPDDKKVILNFNTTVETLDMLFDREQVSQALLMLIANSVRFTPHDCKVQASVFMPTSGEVKILVADNGVGIKDEYKPHAFDHIMVEGEDLGLDRVRAIIEAHDGTIRIEDNPGGGTVFVISLPVVTE